MARAAVLDVDGTLVDSNYHHALAWYRAFWEHGVVVPLWRLHRHVGMGGDKYVAAVAGAEVEDRLGDRLRGRWEALFDAVLDEVQPLPGADKLIRGLKARGYTVVLASSAIGRHLDTFLDKLEVRDVVDAWTTKDEVEASKPNPDLVEAALSKAGTRDAVMVGDTTWDCFSASAAGIPTIGVLSGGYCERELVDAGAVAVFDSADDLASRLDQSPFARG